MNLQLARRGWWRSPGTSPPRTGSRTIPTWPGGSWPVRPGSIILLHDSIGGHVDADHRVVIEALPRILGGLERKGLQPVRLDRLIGGPAYLPDSDC